MSIWPRRVSLTLFCIFILSPILGIYTVTAQETIQAEIAPVDTASFPLLTTYLELHDQEGNFIYGLKANDVQVQEDDRQLPVKELTLLRPGAQFVLAASPGESFTIRDSRGSTRYDYLLQALETWASSRTGSTIDDLSFLASGGPESTHLSEIEQWIATIKSYIPAEQEPIPGFDILARAIDIAADPAIRPGMGRAVLFVTSLPPQDISIGLQSLAARAIQREVKISVWLVASTDQFNAPGAVGLADLAEQTGGSFFAYSGQEPIPDVEENLESIRSAYYLAYDSQISTSGTHQLSVEVKTDQIDITTPVQEFDLEVLPPSVSFVSSTPKIVLSAAGVGEDGLENVMPKEQALEIVVGFPDRNQRPLKRATLYVDGTKVDENTSPPFEHFSWDLSTYTESGQHSLKAEVEDNLGLIGSSGDIPVVVSTTRQTQNAMLTISKNRTLVAGLVVILAGAVLVLVLILGGRLRPGAVREYRRRRKRLDPVTQPVVVKPEPVPQRRSSWVNRLHWPQRRSLPQAYAYLVHLADSDQDSSPPIPILTNEVTFGSDPAQASQLLDDNSVSPIHARLRREVDGSFRVADEGSTAGTWVNYTPVSREGVQLEHGDLVHLGRLGFRFMLREPKQVRKPVVLPEEAPQ